MTEEHLLADWAYRAFSKSRKPKGLFLGRIIGPEQMRIDPDGEPVPTAKVICRACNNGWLSRIDNAAADVLKPLVRGEHAVVLDREGQTAVAAWIYKTALILDAGELGPDGELAVLRPQFMGEGEAGPGCVIYAGPASKSSSLTVGEPATTVNLWMLGVRPTNRVMRLQGTVVSHDGGKVHKGEPKAILIPGYQIMVGALWAYLGGRFPPVDDEALQGFERIWPAQDAPVTLRAASLVTRPASGS